MYTHFNFKETMFEHKAPLHAERYFTIFFATFFRFFPSKKRHSGEEGDFIDTTTDASHCNKNFRINCRLILTIKTLELSIAINKDFRNVDSGALFELQFYF